jgi:hypothetical protein
MFEAVPVEIREQTTEWDAASGLNGRDERMLDEFVPPGWTRHARYRSDIDFIAVGGSTALPLANTITLNAITAAPPWGDVQATMMLFGADAVAPSAQLDLCLDTPHVSHWELDSAALLTYPGTPGLYPMWTTLVSSAGVRDEQKQEVSYHTSCKHVGGYFPDADNDCLPNTVDAHSLSYEWDYDSDGLIDGIDLAWAGNGPCPNGGLLPHETADCDGDGLQDAEEHFSSTNPRLPDTDGDGWIDSGLSFDCDGDGAADAPSRIPGADGVNRIKLKVMYCKPDGLNTNLGNLGGRPWGNVNPSAPPLPNRIDNCPNHDGPQTNTATTDPDLDSAPAAGDTNGRFAGTADTTHPDGRFSGDACSPDDDNDGISDLVEGTLYFDAASTDSKFCNTADLGVPAVILPNVRDTDGDGSIDGVECQFGRNPADPASRPQIPFTAQQQVFFRLTQLTQPGTGVPMLMNLDDGTTIAGVSEARGLGPGGASQVDHDRDGCADEVEAIDVDGNRVAGDSDRLSIARAVLGVSLFAPPGSATPEERRTADVDFNGALGDPDRLAAARIVLTASLPSIPDYNLNCTAAVLGYNAN